MFNQSTLGGTSGYGSTTTPSSANPMKDFEVTSPPDDSVSSLAFSPATIPQNFLIAGSWDNNVRCWEVEQTGKTIPKSMQTMQGPVLDVCWSDVMRTEKLVIEQSQDLDLRLEAMMKAREAIRKLNIQLECEQQKVDDMEQTVDETVSKAVKTNDHTEKNS